MRIVAGTRLWSRPANSARTAPGSEATKLTTIATGEIRRLNRNWSPGWSGSSEYAQDAPLRHEHVGREERAEDEGEAAGDVQERRQEPDRAGEQLAGRLRRSPDRGRSPGARQGRRQHQDERQDRRPDDGARGEHAASGRSGSRSRSATATARTTAPIRYRIGAEPAPG